MRYTYDNSKANPHNPNQPPRRVRYGLESSDEMGELWLQFLPHRETDMPVLQRDFIRNAALPDKIALCQTLLGRNPKDAFVRADLAAAYLVSGRRDEAAAEARRALKDDPKTPRAHYVLGSLHVQRNEVAEARAQFEALVAIDPEDAEAQNNLGFLLLAEGKTAAAIPHLEKALELNPADPIARKNLEKARAALNQ
jgi:Flp pilus assembly protein TadD